MLAHPLAGLAAARPGRVGPFFHGANLAQAHGARRAAGNMVRQAVSLLLHFPGAAAAVPVIDVLEQVDRPGIALLVELLAQLRGDPAPSTAALLERWRDRPDYATLARLAVGECLVPDEAAAAAEIRSALDRLVADHALARLHALQEKAATEPLSAAEKAELQGLLRIKAQSARPAAPK